MLLASTQGAAVGVILALGGVALIVWGITGSDIEIKRFGRLGAPPRTDQGGGITRKFRMTLALVFGVLLIIAGVVLALT